jgi:hypothetical protein
MAPHGRYPIAFPILDDAQITALGQFAKLERFQVAAFAGGVSCLWNSK